MAKSGIKFPSLASPNIERVLRDFLEDRAGRQAPATRRKYLSVIQVFTISMNNYAYQSLNQAETAIFNRSYDAQGSDHREFCQIFGPEKIPENVGEFLGYFMPRKVFAGKGLRQEARVVIRQLAMWLHEQDYIDGESKAEMIARSKER